ncbi:MAG: acetyl-CoA acetyltransferase [Acidimicrobiia bacterium]|nr:acetyl-CoA acetyltransferase [Acidimicrobiia bacterium]
MAIDPRTPVVVGIGQVDQRPENLSQAEEPYRLMSAAVAAALADSGAPAAARAVELIAVVQGAWSYTDPARLVADRLGITDTGTALITMGGQAPQAALNTLFTRIQRGELDAAVVTGGETIWSRRKLRARGERLVTTRQTDAQPDEILGHELTMSTPFEEARGIDQPPVIYPIFESAIRAANGETIDEHRARLGELWAGFNRVAVANEHAWIRRPMTAEEIVTPTTDNRMVGFPYTKAMNSNWYLDQAAAVFVTSAKEAERLGVGRDRWVFPWTGGSAHDTPAVTNRRDLHSSPAIGSIAEALYRHCRIGSDDIDHVDLYSCFPSAVQIGAAEFGFGLDRPLTVTGGLTFAGGPLNNYVTHSVAAMVEVLRNDPGVGLVTANGGYVTKHTAALYRSDPPPDPWADLDTQTAADRIEPVPGDEAFTGDARIEGYTVMHHRSEPPVALVAVRTPSGARSWGRGLNEAVCSELMAAEGVGRPVRLGSKGQIDLI